MTMAAFHLLVLLLLVCHGLAFVVSPSSLPGWQKFTRIGANGRRPVSHFFLASSDESPATTNSAYQVTIEYCTGCRWGLRSFWMASELLTTFQGDDALEAVTLIPTAEPGGVFDVKCYSGSGSDEEILLWDRKEQGGFPEMKEVKQRVRDLIDPELYLGHSDRAERQDDEKAEHKKAPPKKVEREDSITTDISPLGIDTAAVGSIVITYCTGCKWLLRAAYMGQELISTFESEIHSLTLVPSRPPAKGGQFTITLDDTVIWDRAEQGGFPLIPELKQAVRDRLAPSKDLGHSDTTEAKKKKSEETVIDEMDDEDAEEARRFFGVL